MRTKLSGVLVLGAGFFAFSCGNGDDGSKSTGGGGTVNGTGGAGDTTGGAFPTGGLPGAGGTVPTGGQVATGGAVNTGGRVSTGGQVATGGAVNTGGRISTGGLAGTGGAVGGGGTGGTVGGGDTGGVVGDGGSNTGGNEPTGGNESTGGVTTTVGERPCDIYNDAGNECVVAYSLVRRLLSSYDGPLYQVRSGSNAQNTGTGGELHDIGQTADGFGDKAAQDAVCNGTTCTVSRLYDQSGRGNDITVAKKGSTAGGQYAAMDDFESIADAGPLKVAGHDVYSLYMEARQGYRSDVGSGPAPGVPVGNESQGIYMLADGTHSGTACCWDFGNVTSTPATGWYFMDTLFFGVAYWGRGEGNGPWFMSDFEGGVWAGGSRPGDPGWGALDNPGPANTNNPSLRVPFAIGFNKCSTGEWALRMANLATASSLTTGYKGAWISAWNLDHQGRLVLGVGGDNSNNSWGTFFEGAIVRGYPGDETEDAVFQNVKAAGYGQ